MWHHSLGPQIGSSALPVHIPMHVPAPDSSTSQHIAPMSQSSIPLKPLPSTVHGSPGAAGSESSGEQRVAFHCAPPSFAHGMHFSPAGQSCANRSHSNDTPPPSGVSMKPLSSPPSSFGGGGSSPSPESAPPSVPASDAPSSFASAPLPSGVYGAGVHAASPNVSGSVDSHASGVASRPGVACGPPHGWASPGPRSGWVVEHEDSAKRAAS